MRRIGLVAAISAGFLALGTTTAYACSCVHWKSAEAQFAAMDVVFVGKVVGETTRTDSDGVEVTLTSFSVERTLKGPHKALRLVAHNTIYGGMCGIRFERGKTTLVMAGLSETGLSTSSCSAPRFPLADFERLASAHK